MNEGESVETCEAGRAFARGFTCARSLRESATHLLAGCTVVVALAGCMAGRDAGSASHPPGPESVPTGGRPAHPIASVSRGASSAEPLDAGSESPTAGPTSKCPSRAFPTVDAMRELLRAYRRAVESCFGSATDVTIEVMLEIEPDGAAKSVRVERPPHPLPQARCIEAPFSLLRVAGFDGTRAVVRARLAPPSSVCGGIDCRVGDHPCEVRKLSRHCGVTIDVGWAATSECNPAP